MQKLAGLVDFIVPFIQTPHAGEHCITMGVATGGDAGDVSPRFEIPGDVP